MGEEGGRPGAGTRHATQPPAGAAAGGRARTIVAYAVPPHGATLKDNNTGLDGGQDNGESSDAAQQHGTTPGTASAVFNSLGYAMADETKTPRQPVQVNNESESKASTLSRQDTGELGNMNRLLKTKEATSTKPGRPNTPGNQQTPDVRNRYYTLAHHRIHLHFHPHNKKLSGPLEASYKMPPGY